MSREAMKQALEALESKYIVNCGAWRVQQDQAITALRQALVDADDKSQERVDEKAKREQGPVAWMYINDDGECEQIEYGPVFDDPGVTPLYTAPPKKQWVGLTDEEIDYQAKKDDHGVYFALGALWAEAKLKEKNT